jgi:hypothetical protein
MTRLFFILLLSLPFFASFSQVVVKFRYEGKNLYWQNPFRTDITSFCVYEVRINDRVINCNLNESAFEIKLEGFKLHDSLEVKIFHHNDCSPKFLGMNNCTHRNEFGFMIFKTVKDSLYWKSKGEKGGSYFIERFEYNTWNKKLNTVTRKDSSYQVYLRPVSGINKYRIRYSNDKGQICYSGIAEYFSGLPALNINADPERKKILFRESEYELSDQYGKDVGRGILKEIDIENFKNGIYYLLCDNRSFKIKIRGSKVKVRKL